MLPHYLRENVGEVEEDKDQTRVSYGKCNKCSVELNHDNYIKNNKN